VPILREMEVGLMFWGDKAPRKTLQLVKDLGVRCGHLGLAGQVPLAGAASAWKEAITQEDFAVTTVFASYEGESYADIPTVRRTVGFIPPSTREAREARTREVIEFASALGVNSFACHVGWIPHDRTHHAYAVALDVVRRICDYTAQYKMLFALETGQETAEALLEFLDEVGRDNLRLNFDPANLVLYGTEDPLTALGAVGSHVVSVHCKDGNWPPKEPASALGTEMPLGEGSVNIPGFIKKLKEVGYRGPLTIEREVALDQDMDDRHKEGVAHPDDIRKAVKLLEELRDKD
jgi:sugar phosphate isomerase/epimerase